MDNIRNSFWGYNKNDVRNLIFEKDQIISAQQKDIEYLRNQNRNDKSNSNSQANQIEKNNSSRFINLEQERLTNQIEL